MWAVLVGLNYMTLSQVQASVGGRLFFGLFLSQLLLLTLVALAAVKGSPTLLRVAVSASYVLRLYMMHHGCVSCAVL